LSAISSKVSARGGARSLGRGAAARHPGADRGVRGPCQAGTMIMALTGQLRAQSPHARQGMQSVIGAS
jgi:hypothetical protein